MDSTVSLARRGLRIDYVTVKRLMVVSPNLREGKIGVWRKGSAADVLVRASIEKKKLNAEIIYREDMTELLTMLKNKDVDAVTVSSAIAKGDAFENILNIPGSCGLHINSSKDKVLEIYESGIKIAKENPEKVAEYIATVLPIKVSKEFIVGVFKNAEFNLWEGDEFREFYETVKKYS